MNKEPIALVKKYGRIFSPSGSSRWLFCTGSVAQEISMRDRNLVKSGGSSAYASQGTVAHKLAADCVLRDVSPYTYIGNIITADDETDYSCSVDLDMANAVNVYVDHVLGLAKPEFDPIIEVERTLDLTSVSPYIHSGTCDCYVYQRKAKHLHVIDYKHGSGISVEVENNTQVLIYALGAIQDITRHHGVFAHEIEQVTLHIVQPRAENGKRPIRTWQVPMDLISWFHEFVLAAIREALSPHPVFSPSESRCHWCVSNGSCIARAELSFNAIKMDFAHLVNYELTNSSNALSPIGGVFDKIKEPAFPVIATLSKAEKAIILKWQNQIEKFLADVRESATESAKIGERIPGFKLVYGRSMRVWTDEKDAKLVCASVGLDESELFTEPAFKSPAQIETVFKAHKIDKAPLSSVITKPVAKLTLAPMDDKRPEVNPETLPKHDFVAFIGTDESV